MKRGLLIGFWMVAATLVCSAQSTFYFPHIANGIIGVENVWKTTIYVANTASFAAVGSITFRKDGENVNLAGPVYSDVVFLDQNNVNVASGGIITFNIPPGQSRRYSSTGTGVYTGASATVSTTAGTVNGSCVFSQFGVGGRLIAEAGTPASTAVTSQAIFVDTSGFAVGLAYANPGTAAAQVNLTLTSFDSTVFGSVNQALGPGNHTAAFTGALFPNAPTPLIGTLQIRSTVPIAATALRFDILSPAFTSIPPVTIAALISPAVEWLEQRHLLTPLATVARLLGTFGIA